MKTVLTNPIILAQLRGIRQSEIYDTVRSGARMEGVGLAPSSAPGEMAVETTQMKVDVRFVVSIVCLLLSVIAQ